MTILPIGTYMAQDVPVRNMNLAQRRPFGQTYAFVVVGTIFLCLLIAAGSRSAPGVLLTPWHKAFGWDRTVISLAAAIGIFLYGLVGPFAAALMQSLGVRRTLVGALGLMALSTFLSAFMTQPWQLIATWGVLSGLASGGVAMVLAATIVNRWFVTHRGLVMGLLTASTATGTLIFLPAFAALAQAGGWRTVVLTISVCAAVMAPLAWLLIPERPRDVGLRPYGAAPDAPDLSVRSHANPLRVAITTLVEAVRIPDFWLLGGAFFICGFTTNGLVGTHLISLCGDHGLPEVQAAGLMAMMGVFDLVGTTASGWLSDRFDPRKLLFWIATVPPTLKLANKVFGEAKAPIVFGWIVAGHQLGAASAAFMAGALRSAEGRYLEAFVIAGGTALAAAGMSLLVGRIGPRVAPAAA